MWGTTVEKLLTRKGQPLVTKECVSVEEAYGVFDKIAREAGV